MPRTKAVSETLTDGRYSDLKTMLDRANTATPAAMEDPLVKRMIAAFDNLVLKGVSQERASYTISQVFAKSMEPGAIGNVTM